MGYIRKNTIILALILSLALTVGAADSKPIGVQKALDKPVKLKLSDARVADVLKRLTDETGAKFVLDEQTYEYLPYGDQTKLNVTLDGYTLREALTPLLIRQGLTWSVKGNAIRIGPSDTLFRMNRRATFEELEALGKLHTAKIEKPKTGGSVINQLRKVTGRSNLEIRYSRGIEGDTAAAEIEALKALPATPVAYLNRLCQRHGWSWHLSENRIRIINARHQLGRQLRRKVTLKYRRADLTDVIVDLARQARIKLTMTPGVMNMLPAETRNNFNLEMAEATIREALEVIAGATGLQFDRTDEGILVKASEFLKKAATQPASTRKRSAYFVQIPVKGPDGTTMMLFVRPEELPADVRKKIEAAKDEYIENIRKMK